MNKTLVFSEASRHLVQYSQMCKAIAACHGFDECKEIINKSVALAAYYAQIKDTETETMFHRLKLRAWRRIGELFSTVSLSKYETQAARVKAIRAAFLNDPTVKDMTDYSITSIIKLIAIPEAEFEHAIKQQVNGSIDGLIRLTPTAVARFEESQKRGQEIREQYEKEAPQRQAAELAAQQAKAAADRLQRKHEEELSSAAEAAMEEVGITLERKDRANMKQVVFLIKQQVHEVMRKAAFDKKITMQEVLRRGLKLWLEANGYGFPDDDMPVKRARSTASLASGQLAR